MITIGQFKQKYMASIKALSSLFISFTYFNKLMTRFVL
jgi:hypothetical protein